MKNITQKQINILVDAIMKGVYNRKELEKQLEEQKEKAFKEFKKTKEFKTVEKLFADNPFLVSIQMTKDFSEDKNKHSYYNRTAYYNTYEADMWNYATSKIETEFWAKYPNEYNLRKEIESELTIRMLGGEDVRALIADLTAQFKGKFNL